MKKLNPLLFISLSLFSLTIKACFKNATIDNVKPYIENSYILTCGDCQVTLNIFEEKKSKTNLSDTNKSNINHFFVASKRLGKKTGSNAHLNLEKIKILDETFDKSVYKAEMLLLLYWLEYSDYWDKNKRDKEKYRPAIKKLISKFKNLSQEPLKITKKANKKYHDLKIILD